MHIKGIKIHIVIVALIIGLAAFLGAQWLYKGLNFQKPLAEKLQKEPTVTSFKIDDSADIYQIDITLSENANLMQSYQKIYNEVSKIVGDRVFKLELTDRRNDRLNEVYNKGKFAVYEALQNGNYVQMDQQIKQYAKQAGVESEVYIDGKNIYWQMRDGRYYLYDVIPRVSSEEGSYAASETGRR